MNPVRYPTPFEKVDLIKDLPEGRRIERLDRLRAQLAEHLPKRPHWHHINDLARWVDRRDLIQLDITILENQIAYRWRTVELPA